MSKLLPPNFDELVTAAVRQFWTTRGKLTVSAQEGSRGSVIAGKNLDGFAVLLLEVARFCGIPDEYIFVTGKKKLTIPGYFRSTKQWDALVVFKGQLVAALELKSQVGSFGNNYNNRSEESVGSATDFWTAYREKAFSVLDDSAEKEFLFARSDSKPPFLGYMMLLEECPKSTNPIRTDEAHFAVFPEFIGSSYAKRYELLIERLVSEKLYSSGSLVLSNAVEGADNGEHSWPKSSLSPRSLYADFAAHLLAMKETY